MPWTRTAVRSLIVGAVWFAGQLGSALAEDEPGGGRGVFAPSPLPSVRRPDEEPPLLDLDITGREGDVYPRIDGELSLEIQDDYDAKSDKKDNQVNDLTSSNDLFLAIRASLQASIVFEDVGNPKPGQNRYFDGMGVFVETLGLAYQIGPLTVFGGKFNPTFGVAWDLAPGIYGADLADDYELTERIGAGGAVTLGDDEVGRHTLTGQVFFLDTSVLSQSWGTERGRTTESDGGVSNTETLQSFSVTLDGDVPQTIDGLRYQVGFERQQHGHPDHAAGARLGLPFRAQDERGGDPHQPLARQDRQTVRNGTHQDNPGSGVSRHCIHVTFIFSPPRLSA